MNETTLRAVQSELEAKPGRWFVPVVYKDKRDLFTVINEGAVRHFPLSLGGRTPEVAEVANPLRRRKLSESFLLTSIAQSSSDLEIFM